LPRIDVLAVKVRLCTGGSVLAFQTILLEYLKGVSLLNLCRLCG